MEISALASGASTSTSSSKESEASQSNFLTLLVTQLTNQDPLEPLKNEDFIAQLAQLESLEANKDMAATLKSVADGQQFASAGAMIGKEVQGSTLINEVPVEIRGVVKSVSQSDGQIKVNVEDEATGNVMALKFNEIFKIMDRGSASVPTIEGF